MTLIGYTMMSEQAGPKQLVRDVARAEEAGLDFASPGWTPKGIPRTRGACSARPRRQPRASHS